MIQATDARNAFALVKPEIDLKHYTVNFGGPIIRKKLDFNINVDRSTGDGTGLVSATTLNGLFTTNVPVFTNTKGVSLRTGLFINPKNTLTTNYNYRGSDNGQPGVWPGELQWRQFRRRWSRRRRRRWRLHLNHYVAGAWI